MLEHFSLLDPEFSLRFERPIVIASFSVGSVLRSAFGSQLRRIVCFDARTRCVDCQVRVNCPYEKIFAPHMPPEADRLGKERDLPRGFVIKPPVDGGSYGPERPFRFRMILVGELIQWFPYILVPFNELGRIGIGRSRTLFRLEQILSRGVDSGSKAEIYTAPENLVHTDRMIRIGFADLAWKAECMNREALTIRFLTPTTLRYNPTGQPGQSRTLRVPEFHVLVKRLCDRVKRLANTYCGEELAID
jgi:hypothetical protein